MRDRTFGIAVILTVLAAGAGLASTAHPDPGATMTPAGWIPVAALLLGGAVLVAGMARRATHASGLLPLAGGWALVALAAAVTLSEDVGRLASDWAGAAGADLADVLPILTVAGTVGIVLGCARWAANLFDASERSGDERAQREREIATLQEKVTLLTRQAKEAATTDDLTGALNRTTFLARLDETIQRDTRLRKPFAFLLVDAVGLHTLRERHGRLAADHALQQVAKAASSTTRGTDFVGRIGDDLFCVVLAECEDAQPAITRLLLALEFASVEVAEPGGNRQTLPLVVHIGGVEVPNAAWCRGFEQLFRLAEERLKSIRGVPTSHMAKTTLERVMMPDVAAV